MAMAREEGVIFTRHDDKNRLGWELIFIPSFSRIKAPSGGQPLNVDSVCFT